MGYFWSSGLLSGPERLVQKPFPVSHGILMMGLLWLVRDAQWQVRCTADHPERGGRFNTAIEGDGEQWHIEKRAFHRPGA